MHIATLTFPGFNEIDALLALGILNRIRRPGWRDTLCCPSPTVTSMNGVVVQVLEQPFFAAGNVATAGGCLASPYLAAWVIARSEGADAARAALHCVAPVGEKQTHVDRAMAAIGPYLNS